MSGLVCVHNYQQNRKAAMRTGQTALKLARKVVPAPT
jgi:hypothetical protein